MTAIEQAGVNYSTCTPHSKPLLWAGALSGVGDIVVREKKRTLTSPFVSIVLRDGLKMDAQTMRSTQTILDSLPRFRVLVEQLTKEYDVTEKMDTETTGDSVVSPPISELYWMAQFGYMDLFREEEWMAQYGSMELFMEWFREEAGMLLRTCKDLWCACLLLTCAYAMAQGSVDMSNGTGVNNACTARVGHIFSDVSLDYLPKYTVHTIRRYAGLQMLIEVSGLNRVWDMKPLLDGSQMIQALGLSPKQIGPLVGKLLDQQVRWQLRNGYIGGDLSAHQVECIEFLKQHMPS